MHEICKNANGRGKINVKANIQNDSTVQFEDLCSYDVLINRDSQSFHV